MPHSQFLSLPDDALLGVLSFLTPRELFACRTVSRRLRDICLHRDLWKKVEAVDMDKGLLRAVLALAPCLHKIDVLLKILAPLVPGSTCVVDRLDLYILSERDVTRATDVLLHLSSSGGVRKLSVDFIGFAILRDLPEILQTIYYMHCLEDLSIINEQDILCLPETFCHLQVQVTPTLKRLDYCAGRMDPFVELLLKTHGDTLQIVELLFSDVPVSLLLRLPRLQSLTCYAHEDLLQLLNLENLDTFQLDYDPGEVPQEKNVFRPSTLKFLRQAPHLKSITLPWISSAALLALSKSRSARVVERLAFERLASECVLGKEFEGLIDVLHHFPALRTLHLCAEPSDDLLRAIGPASLPCLTKLVVPPTKGTCIHSWLHEPAIQDLLVRNPDLHLFTRFSDARAAACCCAWCRWGCHSILRGRDLSRQPVSSHESWAGCNCVQVAEPTCRSCKHPYA